MRHRPIGIGVQGLPNVFYKMGLSFDSDESKKINEKIFEHIYYGAVKRSMEISRDRSIKMNELKIMKDTDGIDYLMIIILLKMN